MPSAEVFSVVFAIASVLGGSLAGLMYADRKTLRDSNTDLRARVVDLESERIRNRTQIAQLQSDVAALSRVVTGESYLLQILDASNIHHSEALKVWRQNAETDAEILDLLRTIMEKVA